MKEGYLQDKQKAGGGERKKEERKWQRFAWQTPAASINQTQDPLTQ
jgi:hypothetical protein